MSNDNDNLKPLSFDNDEELKPLSIENNPSNQSANQFVPISKSSNDEIKNAPNNRGIFIGAKQYYCCGICCG